MPPAFVRAPARLRARWLLPWLIVAMPGFARDSGPTLPVFKERVVADVIAHTQIGDIDGDGHNDIVLQLHRDDINIKAPGRETGLAYLRWPTFERVAIFRGDVAGDRFDLKDVNRDGRLDIVSALILPDGRQAVAWYENPGPAGKSASVPQWMEHVVGEIPKGEIKDVLAGDIDHDGRTDLVVRMLETTSIFLQTPGAWVERKLTHVTREGLALADLDGDGDLDLVLNGFWFETPADPRQGEFIRHTIDEKWFNQKTGTWRDNACYVRVADIDGDGRPDVILSHSEKDGYPVSWYSTRSATDVKSGPWIEHRIVETFDWCETLDVADLDHDGHPDILAGKFPRHTPPGARNSNSPPYPVSVFYNAAGDGSRWTRQDLTQDGIYAGVIGDVGSDGQWDIVGPRSYFTGPVRLWENVSPGPATPAPSAHPSPAGPLPPRK